MFLRKIFVTLAGVWALFAASTAFKINSLGMFERLSFFHQRVKLVSVHFGIS